jgi:hypothetical protein
LLKIKKDDQSNISIETLYDYLKNLNTNIDNDNNNIDIDINIVNLSPEMEEIYNYFPRKRFPSRSKTVRTEKETYFPLVSPLPHY